MGNKKKSKKLTVCIMITMLMMNFNVFNFSILAEAASFSNSVEKAQLFAVPEGGWSTITAKVGYTEEYNPVTSSQIALNKRHRTVMWRREYATSCPTIQLLNIGHSNGKSFSSFSKEQLLYGASWQGASGEVNTQSVTVNRMAGVTGNLPFILACTGGVPSSVTGSVYLTFK